MGLGSFFGEDESTRSFLERRERELLNRLELARANVQKLDFELNEVRRLKEVLGPVSSGDAVHYRLEAEPGHFHFSGGASSLEVIPGKIAMPPENVALSPVSIATAGTTVGQPSLSVTSSQISIKELVMRAMHSKREFKQHGATSSAIRDFIKDAFGREIGRTSLSPQLSRLRAEGFLKTGHDAKWHLAEINEASPDKKSDDAS